VTFVFDCLFLNEERLKVTPSHLNSKCCISETVQDGAVVTTDR